MNSSLTKLSLFLCLILVVGTIWGNGAGQQDNSTPPTLNSRLSELKGAVSDEESFLAFLEQLQQLPKEMNGGGINNGDILELRMLETIADASNQLSRDIRFENSDRLVAGMTPFIQHLVNDSNTNGMGGIEAACRLAGTLDFLGKRFEVGHPKTSQWCFGEVGKIARNLYRNPGYPVPARGGLATFLLAEARGLAMSGDDTKTLQVIQEALNWGLVEFDKVLADKSFSELGNFPTISAAVAARQAAYRQQIEPGIQNAINNFQSFGFDFSLFDIKQNRVTKSHLAGNITVVDLWGTWCAPCRAEIPHLNRLSAKFAKERVKVVGIAVEQGETIDAKRNSLETFLNENEVNYQCLLGNEELVKQLPNFKTYPTMVFLDSNGRVRFSTSGYLDETQLEVIVEHIRRLDSHVTSTTNKPN